MTGSAGLIGSEAVSFFDDLGFDVHGVDNNMRASFFGPGGDTTWNRQRLEASPSATRTTTSTSATARAWMRSWRSTRSTW